MGWFRSRARFGGWLALLALTLQLILTFGHVHLDRAAPLAPAGGIAALAPDDPGAPPAPDHAADDYCAICALVHLAGALTLNAAPALPVPLSLDRTRPPPVPSAGLTAPHLAHLRARAPPIA